MQRRRPRGIFRIPPAATESFSYDSNGYLDDSTDWNGNETKLTNNSYGAAASAFRVSPAERSPV
ncbi:MAG TPA: hypothetical protein VLI55_00065 [Bryobacteraceae bacterium]|nr:hypothetical protein [Bryobacteraceae bacterium]